MKCINKMRLLCLCGIAAVFMSGCGQTVVSYDNPYDIYSTSADYGLASEGAGSEKTYFSQNLCVADDVNIGNDTTDSQVAEGAGTFNLATNTVTYAQNIYEIISCQYNRDSDRIYRLKIRKSGRLCDCQ